MRRSWLAASVLAFGLAAGCGSIKSRVETVTAPSASLSGLKRIVLTPLVNRADDPGAALVMRAMLARSLALGAHLEVLDAPPGTMVDPETFGREQARDVARAVGADAVITGIVFAYGYVPEPSSPPRPTVRLDLRVFGAEPASLLWAARASASDASGLGSGGETLTTVAMAAADRLAAALAEHR